MDYKFSDVLKHAKIKKSELTYWTKAGLVRSATPRKGTGYHRQFSFFNVLEATVAGQLHGAGVATEQVGHVIDRLRLLEKNLDLTFPSTAALAEEFEKRLMGGLKGVEKSIREECKAAIPARAVEMAKGALRELAVWKELRDPSDRPDGFFGIVYQVSNIDIDHPDPRERAYALAMNGDRQLDFVALRPGEAQSITSTGAVQLRVDIGEILRRLERSTGDSLGQSESAATASEAKKSRPKRKAARRRR